MKTFYLFNKFSKIKLLSNAKQKIYINVFDKSNARKAFVFTGSFKLRALVFVSFSDF